MTHDRRRSPSSKKQQEEQDQESKRLRLLEQNKASRKATPPPGKFHSDRTKWRHNRARSTSLEDYIDPEEEEELPPFWGEDDEG